VKKKGDDIAMGADRPTTPKSIQWPDNHCDYTNNSIPAADTLLTHIMGWVVQQYKRTIMIDFLPARLVRARDRWYICYYQRDPVDGIRKRHRDTFDLNRLATVRERTAAARIIIQDINSKLPYGYPYEKEHYTRTISMPADEAIAMSMSTKNDLRQATINSYRSTSNKFLQYLEQKKLLQAPVGSIDESLAQAYSDHLQRTGISGCTHNNDIAELKAIFSVLKDRRIIFENPWCSIKKRRVKSKTRKPIRDNDVLTILEYLKANDKSVYLSCLLLYYCMIRPNEQRYITRSQIDLARSIIYINGERAKNHKDQIVTLPDEFHDIMISLGIDELKPRDYILGYASSIGSPTPIGKNTTSARYHDHILFLYNRGRISTREGNTLYSWKDTGGDALAYKINDAVKLKNQFRHHSLDETQAYLSGLLKADPSIKNNHILPTKT